MMTSYVITLLGYMGAVYVSLLGFGVWAVVFLGKKIEGNTKEISELSSRVSKVEGILEGVLFGRKTGTE